MKLLLATYVAGLAVGAGSCAKVSVAVLNAADIRTPATPIRLSVTMDLGFIESLARETSRVGLRPASWRGGGLIAKTCTELAISVKTEVFPVQGSREKLSNQAPLSIGRPDAPKNCSVRLVAVEALKR
jgi:hypothetical protein